MEDRWTKCFSFSFPDESFFLNFHRIHTVSSSASTALSHKFMNAKTQTQVIDELLCDHMHFVYSDETHWVCDATTNYIEEWLSSLQLTQILLFSSNIVLQHRKESTGSKCLFRSYVPSHNITSLMKFTPTFVCFYFFFHSLHQVIDYRFEKKIMKKQTKFETSDEQKKLFWKFNRKNKWSANLSLQKKTNRK